LALLKAVEELRPDVVITDVTMPLLNGIDAAKSIIKLNPKAKIVFLTMHPDVGYATAALSLGSCGYVLKSSAADELMDAIHAVVRGETYVTPRIAGAVIEQLRKPKPDLPHIEMTARERQILQLIAEGRTFKEIATILNISPRTVEFHRNKIAEKTGFRTTAELARYAVRIGILDR
jgi:DNA-binding NarL/FixJ family response regulator